MKTELLELCDNLAAAAHATQTRFDGSPYIAHPRRVAARVRWQQQKAVALLHDVLEDSDFGDRLQYLHEGGSIPTAVMLAVCAITKRPGEDYMEYLRRVKADPLACEVKIADMLDNLSDTPTKNQVKRYAIGLAFLLSLEPTP